MEVLEYLVRWGHYIFGVTWIGLLYYFNFIQGGYMASASSEAKVSAFTKLVPNALWYFRFAALFTFLTGIVLLYQIMSRAGADIMLGVLMGTLMFLNVWLIIWPNQKIVIASNESIAAGGEADPNQASAAGKALLASRTNTLLSLPMLFFMGSGAHAGGVGGAISGDNLGFVISVLVIAALEVNAIVGKQGPITTVKGVIGSSVVLTAVFVVLSSVL